MTAKAKTTAAPAKRTRRTRRRTAPKVQPVDVIEEEEEEEEEEPTPTPAKRTRRTRKTAVVDVEEDEDEDEDEEEPTPPTRRARKTAVVDVEEDEDEDEDEDADISTEVADGLNTIVDALEEGKSVLVTKTADGWLVQSSDAVTTSGKPVKKTGGFTKAYWEEVHSDEYSEFQDMWTDLTAADKAKLCKKNKVTWDEHVTPNINAMRMSMAYRDKMGITKYKPEYQTRAQRDAVRGL